MKLRLRFPNGKSKEVELTKSKVRLGRDPSCEVSLDAKQYPKVSSFHAELINKDGHVWLLHRSKSNDTVLNNEAISKPVRLKLGDKFTLGFTGPAIEYLGISPATNTPDKTILSAKASDFISSDSFTPDGKKYLIGQGGYVGRDKGSVVVLEHPHVSRRHAVIKVAAGQTIIADARSSNGTYVNGVRIKAPVELRRGDLVDIGPFSLTFDGESLVSKSRADNIRVDVDTVSYLVSGPNGKPIQLLNDVSFEVNPGEFICIVGPSGSGKSTLLKIVSGRNHPSNGLVGINNRDLHRNFNAFKEDLVVVPQSSSMHESLSVIQTVSYVGSLRLPGDSSQNEVIAQSNSILNLVGLSDRQTTKVSQLSGGQLKRLGLACELISNPSLIFLDEVTSGLDEKSDGEMMALFRKLADSGKTLLCVTHNLAHVEAYCHKVLVLTRGGRVAYFGTPKQACEYFKVRSLGGIYAALETKRPDQWSLAFLNQQPRKSVVKISSGGKSFAESQFSEIIERVGVRPFRQTLVLTHRYLAVWLGEWQALMAMMGQALLVTVLLCLVFNSIPEEGEALKLMARKTEIRNLLFLLGVSCFWLGANNAAKEVVKERSIYQRERDFNLVPEAFWASKVIVLAVIGAVQATLLTLTVSLFCGLPGNVFANWCVGIILSFLGTNLGLAISANSRSEELAVALVPAAIIPQIILAGVVAKLSSLPLLIAKVSISSLWGQKLFEKIIPEADRIPDDFQPEFLVCLAVLFMHCCVYMALAWFGLRFAKHHHSN